MVQAHLSTPLCPVFSSNSDLPMSRFQTCWVLPNFTRLRVLETHANDVFCTDCNGMAFHASSMHHRNHSIHVHRLSKIIL